jgi:hypothetical protein
VGRASTIGRVGDEKMRPEGFEPPRDTAAGRGGRQNEGLEASGLDGMKDGAAKNRERTGLSPLVLAPTVGVGKTAEVAGSAAATSLRMPAAADPLVDDGLLPNEGKKRKGKRGGLRLRACSGGAACGSTRLASTRPRREVLLPKKECTYPVHCWIDFASAQHEWLHR